MRLALLSAILICSQAIAQENLDRFRPRAPVPLVPKAESDRDQAVTSVPQSGEGDSGIPLRGLLFVDDISDIKSDGTSSIDGVTSLGVPFLNREDFSIQLGKYLNQPISLDLVDLIAAEVALYYKDHNRPVVNVVTPEQDITNGVVQFLVTEARIGEIKVAGNQHFKSSLFNTRLDPGGPILMSTLEADTAFYGRNPFRSVTAELAPGDEFGESDITLMVKDEFPLRIYAGYDNSGVESTGENRLFTGLNYGNLFGLGQEVSYQFSSSDDFEQLLAHSAVWTIPLSWMHLLEFSGVYAESNPELGNGFDLTGESWQLGSRYIIPLRKLGRIEHEVAIGYDFKFTNNNLLFGGLQVFDTPVEVSQFSLGYLAAMPDQWGRTTLSANGFWSPGGMGSHNNDVDFNAVRLGSDSDYVYATLGLDRITRLPYDFTLATSANGQISEGNLQGTEQFLLGGYSTVRGYDELVASGDRGFGLRNEIYTPAISLLQLAGLKSVNDQLQFLAFHDFGVAEIADPLPGEGKNIELQSAGLGLRWQIEKNASIRFDYGWQLEDIGLADSSRAHLGVTVSY